MFSKIHVHFKTYRIEGVNGEIRKVEACTTKPYKLITRNKEETKVVVETVANEKDTEVT